MILIALILIILGLIGFYTITMRKNGYTFNIFYDDHYSHLSGGPWIPRLYTENKLRFIVDFDETCLYELHGKDRWDINKLYGYSEGDHRQNSARIGWRGIDGYIQLFAYYTIDGKDHWESLGKYNPGDFIICEISQDLGHYYFKVESTHGNMFTKTPRTLYPPNGWFKYILRPYFGGNQRAPRDIQIKIQEIW